MSEATPNLREARRMLGKGIVIAGVGETEQGKLEGRGSFQLLAEVTKITLDDAGHHARRGRRDGHRVLLRRVDADARDDLRRLPRHGAGLLRLGGRRRGDRPPDGGAGGARDRRRPGRDRALRARRQHPLGHQLLGDDRDGARDEPRRLRGPLRPDHDRRLRPAGPALHVRARRAPGGARGGRRDPVRARRPEVERDAARRGHGRGRHERPLDRDPVPRHGLLAGLRRRGRLPRDDRRPGQVDAAQAGLHHRHRRGLLAPVHLLGHLGQRRPPGPRPRRPARDGGRRDHRAGPRRRRDLRLVQLHAADRPRGLRRLRPGRGRRLGARGQRQARRQAAR